MSASASAAIYPGYVIRDQKKAWFVQREKAVCTVSRVVQLIKTSN